MADQPPDPEEIRRSKSEMDDAIRREARRLALRGRIGRPLGARERGLADFLREEAARGASEDDLVDAAIEWLEEKWGTRPCPYCEDTDWEVSGPLEITLASGETITPSFPVMCSNCGQTVFVNAVRAGLVPEDE